MKITVITVPDCPNTPVVRERITAALGGREAPVELIEVREQAQAARWGMTGSPTVLVDGVDPFAVAGAPASVSCRLYRDEEGRHGGAPSIEALRQAFTGTEVSASAPVEECCGGDPEVLDPIGRSGRGRRAPGERGLRAVHQTVLRHFAATGHVPEPADLAAAAASAGRTAADVLDELGHEDITVASCDPVDGRLITVTFTSGTARWEPVEAVVFVGQRAQAGPAATVCCDALNFFADSTTAGVWARQYPEVHGRTVGQAEALRIAEQTFGPLLDRG